MNNLNTERISHTRKKIKIKIQKIHLLKTIKKNSQIHLIKQLICAQFTLDLKEKIRFHLALGRVKEIVNLDLKLEMSKIKGM